MADRNVPTTDSFEQWRITYNSSAVDIGDIGTLNDSFSGTATDLVEGVNKNTTTIATLPTAGFAIAMAVALG